MPYFDYNRTPTDIIHACQDRSHEIYHFKRNTNLYRNQDLLAFFGETDVLRIDQLTPRMQEIKIDDNYSEAFEAKRAGELIRWGTDHGVLVREIVDRMAAWRLVNREMQYLLVGPATRQREIRIRGLTDQVARAEANKLFNRECKRRDKALAKETTKQRDAISKHLDIIMRLAPELALPDDLERFRVTGPQTTFAEARFLLIDAAADDDKWTVLKCVATVAIDLLAEESKRVWAIRNSSPLSLSDDDSDALGGISF